MTELPIIECAGCGACCLTQRTPPFSGAEEWATVPPALRAEIDAAALQPLEVRPDSSPCLWLDLSTRRCRHYDIRPEICREFEVGGPDCRRIRRGETQLALESLGQILRQQAFRFGAEIDLQDDVEWLLAFLRLEYTREHHLDQRSVIDFRVGRIGLECKIGGSPQEVLRQCRRYLEFDELDALLLVTSRPQHRWGISELGGKPFGVVWVAGRF